MTDKDIKEPCKLSVRGNNYISDWEKECIAAAIDRSQNMFDLFMVAIVYININPR